MGGGYAQTMLTAVWWAVMMRNCLEIKMCMWLLILLEAPRMKELQDSGNLLSFCYVGWRREQTNAVLYISCYSRTSICQACLECRAGIRCLTRIDQWTDSCIRRQTYPQCSGYKWVVLGATSRNAGGGGGGWVFSYRPVLSNPSFMAIPAQRFK